MNSFILPLLLLIPLIGAILSVAMSRKQEYAKYVAIICSAVTLAITLFCLYDLSNADYVYAQSSAWIDTESIKISFAVGVDGMSMLMILLTSLLVLLVSVFSSSEKDRPSTFFALIMAMEVGLLGVYMAQDYFLFYIFWEVTLIPMYFLISGWGGPRRHYAAIKFFIYTHVASLVMLIGIFALAMQASAGGALDFSFEAVKAASMAGLFSPAFQLVVFGMLFFGFAVKMPLVPFHTWLPDAHVEAPTAGSVLLAGVMLKMGSYGIIRVCLDVLPDGAHQWQTAMIVLAIIAILYGAYACIAQKDLKKMVAFSSISHMGMVLLGIAMLSGIGIQFAIFQMFAHGLITAVLFMVCGIVGHNAGTREIPLLGGLAGKMPVFAAFMMFGFLASLGLPGLVGFVAEFGIIMSFFEYLADIEVLWPIVFALASLMLTAGYYLWAMQRTLFGKETDKIDLTNVHDVSKLEGISLGVLCALIALFGILPALAMGLIENMPLVLWGVV
ncbi:MAG: NADH-quinone oxidoreductase subunit M [Methanomassiliicoccaceae archaeon]|nr:NADH-quinone oxidoreductase subunit M [Methanomassiliicoccaceae archaeon]